MFAVRRLVRSKLSLKNHLYTSSVIRCDKPKNPKSEEKKPKLNKKTPAKGSEPKLVSRSASKKRLTAELNAEDYANFKSQKLSKLELYSNKSSIEEKLEAKKSLRTLTKEIENEVKAGTPKNEKLKTVAVAKPKKAVKPHSEKKLVESAKAVALDLGGDAKKTEKDILEYLKGLNVRSEKKEAKEGDEDILNKQTQTPKTFKADGGKHFNENKPGFFRKRWTHSKDDQEQEGEHSHMRNQDFEQPMRARSQQYEPKIKNIILRQRISEFKPLGLFKESDFKDDSPKLKTWDELEEWELQFAVTVPPRNYFEELIQWTEEGKLWHFPIDNDQGNEVEANVDFTEHVFLEEHLEPWCPKRGPLRHFMELVLTGLAKNYHLTAEEKKEHIHWYRDYFEGKKKLLRETGTLDNVLLQEPEKSNSKPENPT